MHSFKCLWTLKSRFWYGNRVRRRKSQSQLARCVSLNMYILANMSVCVCVIVTLYTQFSIAHILSQLKLYACANAKQIPRRKDNDLINSESVCLPLHLVVVVDFLLFANNAMRVLLTRNWHEMHNFFACSCHSNPVYFSRAGLM